MGASLDPYQKSGIKEIVFGRTTGGRDQNRDGVDESLRIVVSCLDYDGDVFKCPGNLRLELKGYDLAQRQRSLGEWNFANEELREHWRVSLLSQGYQFDLPWKIIPASSPVTLIAEFVSLDGRQFDIKKDIDVAPPPMPVGAFHPSLPMPEHEHTSVEPELSRLPKALVESVIDLELPEPTQYPTKPERPSRFSFSRILASLKGEKQVQSAQPLESVEAEPQGPALTSSQLPLRDQRKEYNAQSIQVADEPLKIQSLLPAEREHSLPPVQQLDLGKPAALLMAPVSVD